MITPSDLAGYQAKAKGKKIPAGKTTKKGHPISAPEDIEQRAFMTWVRIWSMQCPELALLHHIPNGGSRHVLEAKKLKALGVLPGVFDLFLPSPRLSHDRTRLYHGLYLEMKSQHGKPTQAQRDFQTAVRTQGYKAEFVYGFDEAKNALCQYLDLPSLQLKGTRT